ncbi:MAG: DUF1573 domain-containing protein [Ferruginibacter sp.]
MVTRITLLYVSLLFASCYTKTKKPDYKFMNLVRQQASLDSIQRTKISLSPKQYYFGKLKTTNELKGHFIIKNIGSIDFNINSIKSNCDCIQTIYSGTKIICPNDSLEVKYILNNKGLSGRFQNSIVVIGNCQYGNQTYYFEGTFY